MFRSLFVCPAGLWLIFAAAADAADPLSWLPSDVNAVMRINVADVYKTPLAKKEGWLKQATESFIHQEAFIPPGTKQIFLAAELDLSNNLASHRNTAVLVPEGQLTIDKLTDWLPGGIEQISGKPGAQFGQDGYVVDAGDGCWLATTHTSRQNIARWLKAGPSKGGSQLPSYLQQALTSKANTAQMILAIDLQDNFSQEKILPQLLATDWFPSETAAKSVAEVLASAYGITIGISIDKERAGIVTLDFGKDAMVLKPVLDKLVAEILQRAGATSDDFDQWKWTVKSSRVTGTGPVSPGGGRKLMSILEPPSITQAISASTEPPSPADTKMAKTSQKYCKSVRVLLDDLNKGLRANRDNHALWFERYGRKIDDLPKLNVDPDLLDFSNKVSSSLRYQGQVQRMSNIQAGTRIQQSGANYTAAAGYISPFGSYGYARSTDAQTADTITAEQNQQAKDVRFSEMKQIEDNLASLRRSLTEKYQLEF